MRDCPAPKFSAVHVRIFAKSSSAAAPRRTRHFRSAMWALFGCSDDLLREVSQIGLQVLDASKFLEFASIQRADAGASRRAQGLEFQRIFATPLLQRAERVAYRLACILILSCLHDFFNEGVLLVGQADIASGHCCSPGRRRL